MTTEALLTSAVYPRALIQPFPTKNTYTEESMRLQTSLKRLFDLVASLLGLTVLSPLFLFIAVLVCMTSSGPVLYKSLRIGKNGRPFHMYKFRTMLDGSDHLRDELYKNKKLGGQLFKIKNDPRLTSIGGFLRKYSLDEFPQLLNVLRNEMSLVGPRPYIPEESGMFTYPYTKRFEVMPGITGPWQVNGRSDISFQKLCELEMQYISSWNIGIDFGILMKTLPCVLLKKGAY